MRPSSSDGLSGLRISPTCRVLEFAVFPGAFPVYGRKMDRVKEIDGLRAIAILMVVGWHYIGASAEAGSASIFWKLTIFGRSGVDLFFVLSGYLITNILLTNRDVPNYFSAFYGRRAFRILPIYFAMVATFVVGRTLGWSATLFDGAIPSWTYLAGLQNFWMTSRETYGAVWLGGTWSLAIEEQFYLVFPLIVRFSSLLTLRRLLIGLLVICPLLRIVAFWEGAPYGSYGYYFLTPFRADNLAIGALIAWYEAAGSITDQIRAHARRTLMRLLCVFPIFAALIAKNTDAHMALWGHTYLAWLYGAVLFVVLQNRGADRLAPLRSGPAAFFARISYALYLVHVVVAFCLSIVFGVSRDVSTISGLVLAASAFGLSVAICEFSYRWLEGPLIKFGHQRFRYGAGSSRRALAPAE